MGLRGCAGRVARAGIGSSGARWEKGAAGPRGRVSRAGIGSSGADARTPPVVMCGEVADLEIRGKRRGRVAGGTSNPQAATGRGCSNPACLLSNPMAPAPSPIDLPLLPLLQPIWADSLHSLSIQELLVVLPPPCQHPLPQLHRFLFLSSSFPLLSCFCLC